MWFLRIWSYLHTKPTGKLKHSSQDLGRGNLEDRCFFDFMVQSFRSPFSWPGKPRTANWCPINPLPLSNSPALPGGSVLRISRAQDPSIHFFECGLHVFHVVVKSTRFTGRIFICGRTGKRLFARSVPVSFRQCSQPGR